METKLGFTKMTVPEFETWIANTKIARTILKIQQHHTFSPAYIHFKQTNHFELQKGMRDYHVVHNGWNDIAQHFTTFPDGTIMTGRSIEKSPACITGQNSNALCIENLGNFDDGADKMTILQQQAIVAITAALCSKLNIPITSNGIVYHHWFDLSSGARNNGTKNNKSCPGTAFFGGNKVIDCETNFLPLIQAQLATAINSNSTVLKYVVVTASELNIRTQPTASAPTVTDRATAVLGAVLRVYKEKNGWLKIAKSSENWVSGRYTDPVSRATINASTLNVRSGAGINFPVIGSLLKGEEVFVIEEQDGWCRLNMDEKWVNKKYLQF